MEYISSDTNVWIDFVVVDRLELPFRLPYVYLMNRDAVEDELLAPPGLGIKRCTDGLVFKMQMQETAEVLSAAKAPKKDGKGDPHVDVIRAHMSLLGALHTATRKAFREAFVMLVMGGTDLAELHTLLKMYNRSYGEMPEELVELVKEAYKASGGRDEEGIAKITNPKGAGRKSGVMMEQVSQAKQRHAQGRSMRKIAEEMVCSVVGRVHKLINEYVKIKWKIDPASLWKDVSKDGVANYLM